MGWSKITYAECRNKRSIGEILISINLISFLIILSGSPHMCCESIIL